MRTLSGTGNFWLFGDSPRRVVDGERGEAPLAGYKNREADDCGSVQALRLTYPIHPRVVFSEWYARAGVRAITVDEAQSTRRV